MKHEVTVELSGKMEDVLLTSQRYKTKIRRTHGTQVSTLVHLRSETRRLTLYYSTLKSLPRKATMRIPKRIKVT